MVMFGGSLLAALPQGFWTAGQNTLSVEVNGGGNERKRDRDYSVGGSRTPTLVSPVRTAHDGGERQQNTDDPSDRPQKRFRGQSKIVAVPQLVGKSPNKARSQQQSALLTIVPEDVIAHCLSFLGTAEDRFALQTTCKLFRDVSNRDAMLANVDVEGDKETGKMGIIQDHDTPSSAAAALAPFARAGNLEALYMLGIVKCYCYQDLKNGILMLKMASSQGFVRSSYTLGIILRDALPSVSAKYMGQAASTGYLPALQELLSAREMKERFGEPNADELRRHLDPICLNRLLLRDYVDSASLRGLNTSHCWNPLCGKWAYKATNANANFRLRRPWGFVFDNDEPDPVVDQGIPTLGGRSVAGLIDGVGIAEHERNALFQSYQYNEDNDTNIINDNNNINNNNDDNTTTTASAATSTNNDDDTTTINTKQGASERPSSVQSLAWREGDIKVDRVSRMKMCSRCCRAKYCSKLCQVYDWRSSQHKMECQFL